MLRFKLLLQLLLIAMILRNDIGVLAVCPQGYFEVNGSCVQQIAQCPANYIYVNGLCYPAVSGQCRNNEFSVNNQCCSHTCIQSCQNQQGTCNCCQQPSQIPTSVLPCQQVTQPSHSPAVTPCVQNQVAAPCATPCQSAIQPCSNQVVTPCQNQPVAPCSNQAVAPCSNQPIVPYSNQPATPCQQTTQPCLNQAVAPCPTQTVAPCPNQPTPQIAQPCPNQSVAPCLNQPTPQPCPYQPVTPPCATVQPPISPPVTPYPISPPPNTTPPPIYITTPPTYPTPPPTFPTPPPLEPKPLTRCYDGTVLINGVCRMIYCGKGIYRNNRCIQTQCPEGTVWSGIKCEPPQPIEHSITFHNTVLTQFNRTEPDVIVNNVNNYVLNNTITVDAPSAPATSCENSNDDDCDTVPDEPPPLEQPSNEPPVQQHQHQKCCYVVTPRTCRAGSTEEHWNCFNRRYRRCGDFCIAPTIYLKIDQPREMPPYTYMPPNPQFADCRQTRTCPESQNFHDCSGCAMGRLESCSSYCYNSPCGTRKCSYYDQRQYCSHNTGQSGCQQQDGCFDDSCSGGY